MAIRWDKFTVKGAGSGATRERDRARSMAIRRLLPVHLLAAPHRGHAKESCRRYSKNSAVGPAGRSLTMYSEIEAPSESFGRAQTSRRCRPR